MEHPISTPVRPVQPTVAVMRSPSGGSAAKSTVTPSSGSGWHRGISWPVFFAA